MSLVFAKAGNDLPSSPGVVVFDSVSYAVGLVWFSSDPSKSIIVEARAEAIKETPPADMVVVRRGAIEQFGLGWSNKGHLRGMPSLAAALASSDVMQTWLIAWPLGDGRWWVGSCHEGQIDLRGDRIFTDENEARVAFNRVLGQQHPGRVVFAPAKWEIPESAVPSAAALLTHRQRGVLVRPLSGIGRWIPVLERDARQQRHAGDNADAVGGAPKGKREISNGAAMAIVVAVVGVFGGYIWWSGHSAKQTGKHAARQVEQWVSPWNEAPVASLVLRTCDEFQVMQSLSVPGWRHEEVNCTVSGDIASSVMQWARHGGLDRDLMAAMASESMPPPLWSVSDSLTAVTRIQSKLGPRHAEGLWKEYDLRRVLTDVLLSSGVTTHFTQSVAPRNGRDLKEPNVMDHVPGEFTVRVEDQHRVFLPEMLDGIPGVVVTVDRYTSEKARMFSLKCYFRS